MDGRVLRVWPDAGRVEAALGEAAIRERFVDAGEHCSRMQWLERLARLQPAGLKRASRVESLAFVGAAMREQDAEPAAWQQALGAILELKQGLVAPLELKLASKRFDGARRRRLLELAEVYERYDARLSEARRVDEPDVARRALARLKDDAAALEGLSRIKIAGIYDWRAIDVAWLEALLRRAELSGVEVQIELPSGGSAESDALVDSVLAILERNHELAGAQLFKQDLGDRSFARVASGLFAGGTEEPAAPLELGSFATLRDEARALAIRVRGWIDEGIAAEEIAVVVPDGRERSDLIDALESLAVPVRSGAAASLRETAVGSIALALPAIVDQEFPASQVARLVASPWLHVRERGCPPTISSYLVRAGVRDQVLGAEAGRNAYSVRLEALAARSKEWERERIGAVRQTCEWVIDTLSAIPARASAASLLRAWWKAIGAIELLDESPGTAVDEGEALDRALLRSEGREATARDGLRQLALVLEQAFALTGLGAAPLTRAQFGRLLELTSAGLSGAPRGARGRGVRLLGSSELVHRRFRRVAIVGLVDGDWPRREAAAGLLTDEDRLAINRSAEREALRIRVGDEAGRAGWMLAEDRLLFVQSLCAGEGAWLSCARVGSDGKERLPSPLLTTLARRSGRRLEAHAYATVPTVERVQTEQELRARVALELVPASQRLSASDPQGAALRACVQAEPWVAEVARVAAIESERAGFFLDEEGVAGTFSGAVVHPPTLAAIAEQLRFTAERPLSASMLGSYANCAFQGLLKNVIALREPESADEELDDRGAGTFWHGVLEVLLPELARKGLTGRPSAEIPDALIDEAIEAAGTKLEARAHTGHPRLWDLAKAQARSMVRRVLDAEGHGVPFGVPSAIEAELRFGETTAAERLREVVIPAGEGEEPVYLRGTIDRLDHGPAKGVLDYKRSVKKDRLVDSLMVNDFQVPLYLYAIRSAGLAHAPRAGWVSLKTGDVIQLEDLFDKREDLDPELLIATDATSRQKAEQDGKANLANSVHGLLNTLRKGDFGMRAHDCGHCGFQAVCRVGTRRAGEES